MVYPGSRSLGCGMCRGRKIKCDETRPGCRRCERYGTQCPGYNTPLQVRFYTESYGDFKLSPRRKKTRFEKPTSAGSQTSVDPTSVLQADATGNTAFNLQMIRQPPPLWDDESICYFHQEYCVAPLQGIYSGHLDFLQEFLLSPSPISAFRSATLASAYLALSRHYKSPELYVSARRCYGDTLRSVNKILSQPLETWGDDVVAAIVLLHLFEDIDGGPPSNRASHLHGIAGLYEARGQNILSKLPGCSLYATVFSQLQIHAFATQQIFKCLSVPKSEPDIHHPPTGVAVMVAKVGGFWSSLMERLPAVRCTPDTPCHYRPIFVSAMNQAIDTRAQIESWEKSLPVEWRPNAIVDHEGRLLVTYSTRWLGTIWMMYHASLIFFYYGVLRCCQSLHDHASCGVATEPDKELIRTSLTMAEKNLARLATIICGSIPYTLGEIDVDGQALSDPDYKGIICYNLIWPLVLVARSQYSTEDQEQLCKRTLTTIQSLYGIHLAQTAQQLATRLSL